MSQRKWMALLACTVALFYWKLLFTAQFSFLAGYEPANQVYSWDHFSTMALRHGRLPLWDPYTQSGHSFIGEMQTGLFDPLKLPLLLLAPTDNGGLLSPVALHYLIVFAHVLGACFMFLLARELGLGSFAALVAGLCFSVGGFMGRTNWPDMLDSAIWLPLVLLFMVRALEAADRSKAVMNSCLAGLALGLCTLGGRLHIAMMNALMVASVAAFFAFRQARRAGSSGSAGASKRALVLVSLTGAVAFAAAAVQLLPSIEYSGLATRFMSGWAALPAREKIPYSMLSDAFLPGSLFTLVFGYPFNGKPVGSEAFMPYFGVLPFCLAAIGVWKHWREPWVRYLAGLAVVAYLCCLGGSTLLHPLGYMLVPYLWMMREAGRFIYLTHFAAALLAGFGVRWLIEQPAANPPEQWLVAAKWVAGGAAAAACLAAASPDARLSEWVHVSLLLMAASCGLLAAILRGYRTPGACFLLVALIVFDLHAFDWTHPNRLKEHWVARDHLEILHRSRDVAAFLRSQPGLFRVQIQRQAAPNLGDAYGVQTIGGMSATFLSTYEEFLRRAPQAADLLNVRFVARAKTATEPGAVYEDANWKVYERRSACPRAWLVHDVAVEPARERLFARLSEHRFDPLRTALVGRPLSTATAPGAGATPGASEDVVHFENYEENRLRLRVRCATAALLVLSEMEYPGWKATVNGRPAAIERVDGLLRGVAVPGGESVVEFRYRPFSVLAGGVLSGSCFLGVLAFAGVLRLRARSEFLKRAS